MTEEVLVTDLNELAGLGAVRSLGAAGFRVLGAAAKSVCRPAARYSRFISQYGVHPNPWSANLEFERWLCEYVKSERPSLVVPVSEAAIVAAARRRVELSSRSIILAPRDEHLKLTLSKFWSARAASVAGLRVPRCCWVSSGVGDWDVSGLHELALPAVVKSDNVLIGGTRYDKGRTQLVHSPEELALALAEARIQRRGVIVQEYVAGYGVGAFLLRIDGEFKLQFAHRRVHEVPYTGGWSALRCSIDDPRLTAFGRRLLDSMDYDGVAMVEFRQPSDGSDPYFMEINGRLWGSLALALHAGADFPAIWARHRASREGSTLRTWQRVRRAPLYCANIYPGEFGYLLSIAKARRDPARPSPGRAICAVIRCIVDPRVRHDHFWWSDPIPALGQLLLLGRELFGGLGRRLQSRIEARIREPVRRRLRHQFIARPPIRTHERPRLLFVCYGNICRSPVAAALARRTLGEWPITSAGTVDSEGRKSPANIIAAARELGLDLESARSRALTAELVENADYILVMDADNYLAIRKRFPRAARKVLPLAPFGRPNELEIADPYGWPATRTFQVLRQIEAAVDGLCAWLMPAGNAGRATTQCIAHASS